MTGSRLDEIRRRVSAHPLVGRSQLKGTFEGSRGFGVAFTDDGEATVREKFPFLGPFLDERAGARRFYPRRGGPFSRARSTPNAFYLNVLVIGPGQGVNRHVDATLSDAIGCPGTTPVAVTVLYLKAPPLGHGGELTLDHAGRVFHLPPTVGAVVHFCGDVGHAVCAVTHVDERISVVCEQYVLTADQKSKLAPFQIQSRAGDPIFRSSSSFGFDEVLQRKQRVPHVRSS